MKNVYLRPGTITANGERAEDVVIACRKNRVVSDGNVLPRRYSWRQCG